MVGLGIILLASVLSACETVPPKSQPEALERQARKVIKDIRMLTYTLMRRHRLLLSGHNLQSMAVVTGHFSDEDFQLFVHQSDRGLRGYPRVEVQAGPSLMWSRLNTRTWERSLWQSVSPRIDQFVSFSVSFNWLREVSAA